MTEDQTPRLGLPVLHIGQAAKEETHNEALALLDMVVSGVVEDMGVNDPPVDPAVGTCWIVGDAPSGVWSGNAHAIAGWTGGGWRFIAAKQGLSTWCASRNRTVRFHDQWEDGVVAATRVVVNGTQVVGAQQPAIQPPTGGVTVDVEGRAVMSLILATMQAHGLIV